MAQLAKRKINDAKLNPVFNVTNAANNASIIHANGNESNEIIRTSSNDGFSDYIGSDLFRIPNWNIKDFIYESKKEDYAVLYIDDVKTLNRVQQELKSGEVIMNDFPFDTYKFKISK